jgi:hypothetical protein
MTDLAVGSTERRAKGVSLKQAIIGLGDEGAITLCRVKTESLGKTLPKEVG